MKPDVLRPGIVRMRGLMSFDYGHAWYMTMSISPPPIIGVRSILVYSSLGNYMVVYTY